MMKIYLAPIIILIITNLIIHSDAYSQWEISNGPGIDRIFSISKSGHIIIAGSYEGGLFYSRDNGKEYVRSINGISGEKIFSVYLNSDDKLQMKIYAASGSGSVFYSADTAQSWINIGSNLNRNRSAYSVIAFDTNLFVGREGEGIFRSTNNGLSWTQVLSDRYVYDLTMRKTSNDTVELYASTDNRICKSSDLGKSWNIIGPGLTILSLAFSDSNLYAAADYGLYQSTDNGTTWELDRNGIATDVRFQSVYAVKNQNGQTKIFAGSMGKGIFVSDDDGNNWKQCVNGLDNLIIRDMVVEMNDSGSMNIYAATDRGVYMSQDAGESWISSCRGLSSATTNALLKSGNTLIAATDRNVFISTDMGNHWLDSYFELSSYSDSPVIKSICESIDNDGDTTYYAADQNLGIFKSTDNGFHWNQTGLVNPHIKSISCLRTNDTSNSQILIFGTDMSLFYTAGNTSIAQQANPPYPTNALISLQQSPYTYDLFAGTNGYGVYHSVDNGNYWVQSNVGIASVYINCLASITDDKSNTTLFAGTGGAGLYVSTNNGNQWSRINDFPVRSIPLSIKPFHSKSGKVCLAVGTNKGLLLYQKIDTGWVRTRNELDGKIINSIEYFDSTLFAGVNQNGVWKMVYNDVITNINDKNNVLLNYSLHQNYPNPFNPTTTIGFHIPLKKFVELKIYDILGRDIKTLVSEVLESGYHEFMFNGNGLSSGIYYYQIQIDGFTKTEKMILLK